MQFSELIHLANYSDGVLYALAFLLLVALAVVIDRFWFLRRTIIGGRNLVNHVASQAYLTHAALKTLHAHARRLPESALFGVAAQLEGHESGAPLDNLLDEAILLTVPTLDRRLWILDTIITLAPLLGLFGTILGMFHAFSVLAVPGSAPTAVTGGVADALVTTAAGIFIAMIGLLAYNGLNNLVRSVVHQLDTLKTLLINRMASPRFAAVAGGTRVERASVAE